MMHGSVRFFAATAAFLIVHSASAPAGIIHQYRLDGTLTDDFAGPSLVSYGGVLGASNYTFGANQGLSLSGGLPNAGNYSVATRFQFSTISGFRKILDFKDRTSDNGLYNQSDTLRFYPVVTSA